MVAAIGVLAWRAHEAPVAVPQRADIAPAQSPPAAPAEVAVHNEPVTETAAVQPQTTPPAPAQTITPHFDIARVEPDGSALVAGGAAPAAEVDLLDDGHVIAHVKTDDAGQFVILPKDLTPGSHLLSLRTEGAGAVESAQTITVVVPQSKKDEVLVALTAPGEPTQILSDTPPTNTPQPVTQETPKAEPFVLIRSVEAGEGGAMFASGTANAGQVVELYLSDTAVAQAVTAADGHWSLTISKGMKAGAYKVRADALDDKGNVVARAEVPFDYPADVAVNTPPAAPPTPTPATPPAAVPVPEPVKTAQAVATADAVVKQLDTALVSHGDSLWRISRKVYGRGIRYTQIYEANTKQIRNPKLIYPGQVLVLPPDVKK